MNATATIAFQDVVTATSVLPVGATIILPDLCWEDYENLLEERGETRRIRFSYNHGSLEVMTLSQKHENPKVLLTALVITLAEELDLMLIPIGSMTLRREEKDIGTEPDDCYYIRHAPEVRGKEIDLNSDPPPDLAIEIDISHPSLDKFPIYAGLEIPELWLFDGQQVHIYQLTGRQYSRSRNSTQFPFLPAEAITEHLQLGKKNDIIGMRKAFREWVRAHKP